jgi:hypothetical protein
MDPLHPTKAYIKSLLLSEDIRPTPDNIEACLYGWRRAVDDGPEKWDITERTWNTYDFGDCQTIGYVTYAIAYGPDMARQPALI